MAYKYKDYLVLSKKDDPVWEEKAEMLRKMVRESSSKWFYSY